MGFLDGLFEIARTVFGAVVNVGKAVVRASGQVLAQVVTEARKVVDKLAEAIEQGLREDPKTAIERFERELQEVNARIQRLRRKYQEHGRLSDSETAEWHRLKEMREALNRKISGLDQVETATDIVEKEDDYESTIITDSNAHVLQYHVGQSTYNKTCSCGRPMVLQWRRELQTAGVRDFFWGCSGWYVEHKGKRACTRWQRLSESDLQFFANLNRPDFQVRSADLTRKALDPRRATRLREALDSVRFEQQKRRIGVAIYRCPVHGESLLLRRKRTTDNGLLDEYFLGCPRWLPDGAGCKFIVKLKSAGQISSVLNAEHRQGVLDTVD